MKIGFGVSVLSKGLQSNAVDGIGTYTKELANGLISIPGIELLPVAFGGNSNAEITTGSAGIKLPPYPLMAGMSACMPVPFIGNSELNKQIDLFHATDHLIPRLKGVPVLATLMDAIPLSHPDWVRLNLRTLKMWLWRQAAHWADHVVTISEYSKLDIVEHFSISDKKISVIPLGVDRRYFERIDQSSKDSTIKSLKISKDFFLFVGTLQPRKNVERILLAHASLSQEAQKNFPLVIVGRAGWGVDELLKKKST